MNARDELARDWAAAFNSDTPVVDYLHASGYRKPRTITTVEELDALADGATLLDRHGDAYQLAGEFWRLAGFGDDFGAHEIDLPAIVLHEGGAA